MDSGCSQTNHRHGNTTSNTITVVTVSIQKFSLPMETMVIAMETYHNDGKPLLDDQQTLKNEGFYRKHTVSDYIATLGGCVTMMLNDRCLCVVMRRTIRDRSGRARCVRSSIVMPTLSSYTSQYRPHRMVRGCV